MGKSNISQNPSGKIEIFVFFFILIWIAFFPNILNQYHQFAMLTLCLAMIILFISRKYYRGFFELRDWPLWFFIICLSSGVANAQYVMLSSGVYLKLAFVLMPLFFIGKVIYANEKNRLAVALIIAVLSTVISTIVFYKLILGFPPTAVQYNPVALGSFMLASLPFNFSLLKCNSGIKKILGVISSLSASLFIILTFSRGLFIGLIASVIFYLWSTRRRKAIYYVVMGLVILTAFSLLQNNFKQNRFGFSRFTPDTKDSIMSEYRIDRAKMAFRILKQHPFFGIGFNHFRERFNEFCDVRNRKEVSELRIPDNMYLVFLAETGLIGTLGLLIFLIWVFKEGYKNNLIIPLTALVGLSVNMGGYDLFYWNNPYMFFCLICGFLQGKNKRFFKVDEFKGGLKLVLCLVFLIILNFYKAFFIENSIIVSLGIENNPVFLYIAKNASFFIINTVVILFLLRIKSVFPFVVFYLAQAIYLLVHFAYFLYFQHPFEFPQYIYNLNEGLTIVAHGAVPMRPEYLIVLIDLPLFIIIILSHKRISEFIKKNRGVKIVKKLIIFALVVLLLFSLIELKRTNGRNNLIPLFGIAGNDLAAIFTYTTEDPKTWYMKARGRLFTKSRDKDLPFYNIICIQVESLDSGLINYKYKNSYITPYLNYLSKQSLFFPHFYSKVNKGFTSDVELAVLNSVNPSGEIPDFALKKYDYPNSLVHQLISSEYDSAAFHNNNGSFFNRDKRLPQMGFAVFYDMKKMNLREIGWGAPDHDLFGYVKTKLKGQKRPFFYYIITMSTHEPHNYVSRYYKNNNYDDIEIKLIGNYFNSFNYVDKYLEDFVNYVKNNCKDTYIFIFGDHPSPLGQDVLFSNSYVPLFIVTPDNKKEVRSDLKASTLDLAPTILSAANINFRIFTAGADLFALNSEAISSSPNDSYRMAIDDSKVVDDYATFSKLHGLEPGKPFFIAHAGGKVKNISGSNSLQSLNYGSAKGYTHIEVDLEWTSDGNIVALHDWGQSLTTLFNTAPRVYSLEEFNNFNMIGGLKQLNLGELIYWLRNHPYTYLITDIKQHNIEGLILISKRYHDIQGRIIPQIYSFEEYEKVKQLGYKDIILTLYMSNYSDDEILYFISKHKVWALTMPIERARSGLSKKASLLKIPVYVHTVNDIKLMNELLDCGVYGFYTDNLGSQPVDE